MAETNLKGPNTLNLSTEPIAGGAAAGVVSKGSKITQDAVHLLHSTEAVRTGAVAHHTFHGLGSTIASNVSSVLGILIGTGVSAYFNHLVHGKHEKAMLEHYRPQIASWQKKDEKNVTVDDLYAVSEDVPGLDAELDRNRHMRNVRTGATLVATTLGFAAVFAAVSMFSPLAALGAAAAAGGLFSAAGIGFVATSMVISLGVLSLASKSAVKIGKKLFGYDKPNVEDHVNGLDNLVKEDKPLTPEKVMGVFVAASPQKQEQIQAAFGGRYDTLTHKQQVEAEKEFGSDLPLEKLTDAINKGQMDPRELMFIAHKTPDEIAAFSDKIGTPEGGIHAESKQATVFELEKDPPALQAEMQDQSQPSADPITANQWREMVENKRGQSGYELAR